MTKSNTTKAILLHLGVIAFLFIIQFFLPDYHHLTITRVMILAIFAMGYNVLFGYVGLLSLGHAMFFGAGLYTAGMTTYHLGWSVPAAFGAGIGVGALASLIIGGIALRTTGVSFMIVTMMFSQTAYLATLYFTTYTRGDEGLVLPKAARSFDFFGQVVDLTDAGTRYNIALILLAITMLIIFSLVRSSIGRALIAIRENEARTQMLGYNTFAIKLKALTISGTISATSGAAYALLFAYVGSTFTTIQYSIDALLYTLLGGAGTVLGPIVGTFMMFFMIDIVSEYTAAYLLVTGVVLIVLVLYFPKGILGAVRDRWIKWLP